MADHPASEILLAIQAVTVLSGHATLLAEIWIGFGKRPLFMAA